MVVLVAFCEGRKVDAYIQSTIFNWKLTIVLQIWKPIDSQEHVFDTSLRHITLTVKYYPFRLWVYKHIWFGFPSVFKINQLPNFKNLEIYIQIQIFSFFLKSENLTKLGFKFQNINSWPDLDSCCLLLDAMRSTGCQVICSPYHCLVHVDNLSFWPLALVLMQMYS